MKKILAAILLATSAEAQTVIFRRSDLSLSPSCDSVFMYRGNNYELQIRMAQQLGLSTSHVFTLYANTNSTSVNNYFSNLVGRLIDSNQQIVAWTISTNDTLMPARTYVFEGIANLTNVTTLFRSSLIMYDSLGSSLPDFAGPWGGSVGTIYVSGYGWIAYAGPSSYSNSLTNQVVTYVSSSTNFIVWRSNNMANSVAYWLACLTNGSSVSGTGGGTNIFNLDVTTITTNFFETFFSNSFYNAFSNSFTVTFEPIINVTNNIGNVNVDASVTVTNYITLTNVVTLYVTNFVSIGDTFVTVPTTVIVASAPGPTTINDIHTGGVVIAASGYGIRIITNGNMITAISDIAYPSEGVAQILQFDGVSNYWGSFGTPPPMDSVGTNVGAMWLPWPATNSFLIPSTNTLLELWGSTGGEQSGAGAYVRAGITRLPVGTPVNVVIGNGGYGSDRAATNSKPFGGSGWHSTQSNRCGGGGLTFAFVGEFVEGVWSNVIAVAPGGGGGSYQGGWSTASGAPGGSIYLGGSSGYSVGGSNLLAGVAPWEDSVFGINIQTSAAGHVISQGITLYGGHYTYIPTNFATSLRLGGGGAGYIGGNAACATNNTAGSPSTMAASGGAGLPWVNTNFCGWGDSIRGAYNAAVPPPGADSSGYTANRGVGSSGSSAGTAGAASRRW